MMRIFYLGCELLHSAAQAWLVLQLVEGMSLPKWEGKRKYTGQAVLIVLAAACQWWNAAVHQLLLSNWTLLIGILIMTTGSVILYTCSFLNALYLNVFGWVGLYLGDFFVRNIVHMIFDTAGKHENILSTVGPERGVYLLAWTAVMIPAGIVLDRWLAGNRHELLIYRKTWLAMMVPILLSIIGFQMYPSEVLGQWAVFLLCCVLLFLLLWISMVKHGAETERKIQQMRASMLESNYQELLEEYNKRAILQHDMKNHMRVINTMISRKKTEEASAYIAQITREMESGEDAVWCNHEMMNLILNMKFQEARKEQIEVQCQCDDMNGLTLTSVEVCALFSNLLDNAIEANKKYPTGLKRRMAVLCARREKMLMISLSNSVKTEMPDRRRSFFETTKEDREFHGFGMRSVQKVIDSHQGHMKVDVKDDELCIVIFLAAFEEQQAVHMG